MPFGGTNIPGRMILYWVAALTTGVIGGLSWWLYGDDRDHIQKGAGGRPGIASPPLGRTAVLLAQYVAPLLIVCCLLSDSLANGMIPQVLLPRYFHPGVAWLWASACIGLPGFALFVAAKLALNTNYSPLYSSKVPGDLTATGPYQYIRHPIYTGNLALLTAGTTMTGSVWMTCIVALLVMIYTQAALLEERALSKKFPTYYDYTCHTGMFLPRPPAWAYTGILRLIIKCGGTTLHTARLERSTDLAAFKRKFEARSGAVVKMTYLKGATVMGYLTKDGRLAAGYVVNTTLPLRYFSFLPDQERGQLPGEPAESDFAEITCIWIDPELVGYFDRGVVYLDSVEVATQHTPRKPFILGGSSSPRVRDQQMHAFTTPLRSFTSKVHKPANMYWIYYGSPDATLIRMVKTMLGVVFNDVGKMLGFRKKRHTAWSNKRKQQAAAKSF